MRLSISVTEYSWPGPLRTALADLAGAADDAGLDALWVSDHLLQVAPGTDPADPMLEAYTALGFLAGRTERIALGAMVTAATFRPAALLVKAVTTLDVLSGGRAVLGIGAGYQQEEADAMGLPLPPLPERFARLEETLRLALRTWAGGAPGGSPQALQRPHPPVLVGGTGEQRTLPLVARYADACNLFDIPDGGATIRRKLDVLAAQCEAVGRPYCEIEKTVTTRFDPREPARTFVDRCAVLARLGIEHVVLITGGPWSREAVGALGALAPALREL